MSKAELIDRLEEAQAELARKTKLLAGMSLELAQAMHIGAMAHYSLSQGDVATAQEVLAGFYGCAR